MKLTLEALSSQLAQRLLPVYLVSGDEPLLVGEAADAIRACARTAGYTEREVFFIERGAAVWEGIEQASAALSLFAQRRLLEIRMPNGKPGTAGAAALQRLFAVAGEDITVLIVTDKLERESQSAAWVQTVQDKGAWLPIWTVDRTRLPQWLRHRFGVAGLSASDQAIALLAERCEGNLLAGKQEIDKLALLLPAGTRVSEADVAAGSADSARFDVFQLGESVRQGDPTRALRILQGLRAEGGEPVLVLWSLVRELRGMQGGGAPVGPGGARRGPRPSWARLVARAARADRMAKGLASGEVWDELALLAVELTGRPTLPLPREAGLGAGL